MSVDWVRTGGEVEAALADGGHAIVLLHLVDPQKNPGALNSDAADQLIEVVHTYLK